ncbi:hypothetical protein PPYR_11350 [Photinus pyralis]|uniref:Uncharacterized protein n=1 Tax=Photinus pyralis TaxID=7054 RepID=A0A1Y1NC39_PHOPY|nr:hypothetical protein PPYR_11350 [Photinus pyralis]
MMFWCFLVVLVTASIEKVYLQTVSSGARELSAVRRSLDPTPRTVSAWSILNQVAMTDDSTEEVGRKRKKGKFKKKLKRFMLPLLLAYKMKFFTLIPILVGGLILLTASTGLAGFFFALFAASLGLKTGYK